METWLIILIVCLLFALFASVGVVVYKRFFDEDARFQRKWRQEQEAYFGKKGRKRWLNQGDPRYYNNTAYEVR